MSQYIPDLTERFPEGFGGVDMTDRYFPSWRGRSPYDWDLMEMDEQMDRYDEIPFETDEEPRQFKVGEEYTKVGFYGGVTTYVVKKIDKAKGRILLAERWYDVDGTGTRPAKWHDLKTDENGNEMALEWTSKEYGDIWINA